MGNALNHLHWVEERHGVGVAAIDSQHREIAVRVNRVIDAITAGGPCQTLPALFDDLLEYVAWHFAYEEGLMREYAYPDAPFHMEEHATLLRQLGNIVRKDPSNPFRAFLGPAFLIDWVDCHALGEDRKLGRFLVDRGLD